MERSLLEFVATLDASLRRSLEEAAADHGDLTISQLRYLDAAHRLDHPTVSDIAEALEVSRASASSAITGLVTGGYLSKQASSDDGRVVHVTLTEHGMGPVRARDQALGAYGEFIRSTLTPREAGEFEAIIDKLAARFAEQAKRSGR